MIKKAQGKYMAQWWRSHMCNQSNTSESLKSSLGHMGMVVRRIDLKKDGFVVYYSRWVSDGQKPPPETYAGCNVEYVYSRSMDPK